MAPAAPGREWDPHPWASLRRFNVREYHRMKEIGLLEGELVELLGGQVVTKHPYPELRPCPVSRIEFAIRYGGVERPALTSLLIPRPWTGLRAFTGEERRWLAEAGILRCREKVELIEGQVVSKAPRTRPHAAAVARLCRLLHGAAGNAAAALARQPLQLGPFSEPEPDVMVLRARRAAGADDTCPP